MVHIPYGKTHIDFEEQGAGVLTSRIGELKAEGSEELYVVTCFSDRDKLLAHVEKEG